MIVSAVASAAVAVSIFSAAAGQVWHGERYLTHADMHEHAELLDVDLSDIDLVWENYSSRKDKLDRVRSIISETYAGTYYWPQMRGRPEYDDSPNELPSRARRSFYAEQYAHLVFRSYRALHSDYFDLLRGISDSSQAVNALERKFHRDWMFGNTPSERARIDVQAILDEVLPDEVYDIEIRQLRLEHELEVDRRLLDIAEFQATESRRERLLWKQVKAGERAIEDYVDLSNTGYALATEIIHLNDELVEAIHARLPARRADALMARWGEALFPYLWEQTSGDDALEAALLQVSDDKARVAVLRQMREHILRERLRWTNLLRAAQLRWEQWPNWRAIAIANTRNRRAGRGAQPVRDERREEFEELARRATMAVEALQEQARILAEDES